MMDIERDVEHTAKAAGLVPPEAPRDGWRPDTVVAWLRSVGADIGRCKGCGARLYWLTTAKGKALPVTSDGRVHFADCPKVGRFRSR